MHTLHTTKAFVLQRFPQGESNYTYKIFTEDLGLLYAHAQSVRELKSRNKYALNIGQLGEVTLVKGREIWRITGAQNLVEYAKASGFERKLLYIIGKFSPPEVKAPELFEIIEKSLSCNREQKIDKELLEVLTMLRIMDVLGFVARPIDEEVIKVLLETSEITPNILKIVEENKKKLIARVNSALDEAN